MKINGKVRLASILVTLMIGHHADGTTRKLEWKDEIQCPHELKFDPHIYDGQRLLNTINMIFTDDVFVRRPLPEQYLTSRQSSIEDFSNACERYTDNFMHLPVIDLSGIEDYRKAEVDQLKEECLFGSLWLRAELGEPSALRQYTPAAEHCSRFISALEGKSDIRSVWTSLIEEICAKNFKPAVCREQFLATEIKQDATDRIRSDVLNYGWQNCSTRYLKVNNNEQSRIMAVSLQSKFKSLFKIRKPYKCPE